MSGVAWSQVAPSPSPAPEVRSRGLPIIAPPSRPTNSDGAPSLDPVPEVPAPPTRDWKVTPALEIRERFEAFTHQNFGAAPKDTPGGYLMQRYIGSLQVESPDGPLFFVQLQSSLLGHREGGPRPTDVDILDLHQAYAQVPLDDDSTVRVGRQELSYGSSRLISNREGPNVRSAFDGIRYSHVDDDWKLDAFVSQPVATSPGIFDDGWEQGRTLFGVYSVIDLSKNSHLDAYYIGSTRINAGFQAGVGSEFRNTVGARYWGTEGGLDYNVEGAYQFGSWRDENISAWTLASALGYTFRDQPLQPRLGLRVDVASGDPHPGDGQLGSFFALYPRGAYFGEIAVIGPSNLIDVHPSFRLNLSPSMHLITDFDWFWRQHTGDGVYGPGLTLIRAASGSGATYVGNQWAQTFEWAIHPHTTFELYYARFYPGSFLKETGPSQPVQYFMTSIKRTL